MGRASSGVKGIALKKADDKVVGMDVIEEGTDYQILTISENGYGKKTNIKFYKTQKRGGSGIKTYNVNTKTGLIAEAKTISNKVEDLLIISEGGQVIKIEVKAVSNLGRSTSGVKIIKLKSNDKVASVAVFNKDEEEDSTSEKSGAE